MDPLSDDDLRELARRSRTGTLSKNETAELERARKQSGSLGDELGRIMKGNA